MQTQMRRIAWLSVLACSLAVIATPARAQFEEEDTVPRFAIGVTGEIVFRGSRGTTVPDGFEVSLGGGPAAGLRAEYRLTRTLELAAAGSYARPSERVDRGDRVLTSPDPFNLYQFTGELLLRVKPNIPGFFILGGGIRYTDPVSSDPSSQSHNVDPFTDPLGLLGAGIAFGQRSSRTFKLDFRVYFVSPSQQLRMDTKSVEIDFGVDLEFLLRF
jgi:hypothetical protein